MGSRDDLSQAWVFGSTSHQPNTNKLEVGCITLANGGLYQVQSVGCGAGVEDDGLAFKTKNFSNPSTSIIRSTASVVRWEG